MVHEVILHEKMVVVTVVNRYKKCVNMHVQVSKQVVLRLLTGCTQFGFICLAKYICFTYCVLKVQQTTIRHVTFQQSILCINFLSMLDRF